MNDIIALLDDPETTVALVGATDNPEKYGNVIFKDLTRKGYTVFPVNPNREKVVGLTAYKTLSDLPEKPTIVNFVVPPEVTLSVLQECQRQNLTNVWLQPGSENPRVITFLQENNFNYLANTCIMVESRLKQQA